MPTLFGDKRFKRSGTFAIAILTIAAFLPSPASAVPITIDFSGVITFVGEFINAVPVPASDIQLVPFFAAATTVNGFIAFDTAQPDTDPDPNVGTYRMGELSVSLPNIGLAASVVNDSMQISSFNDVPNVPPNDEFFAFSSRLDSFVGDVGGRTPNDFSAALFGDVSMLADDSLPLGPLNWTFGNASFVFNELDTTGATVRRQLLIGFEPTGMPEPTTFALMGLGWAGVALVRRRRRVP